MNCRHCGAPLAHVFLDLGFAPPSNAYRSVHSLQRPELYYPLKLFVCDGCWLVQTEDYAAAEELFDADYAYFSSTSRSWLAHAERYAQAITARLRLDRNSFVIEVASNDGYLLRNFLRAGVPCLGIEPTASTAAAAEAEGVPSLRKFFGSALARELAAEGKLADLVIGNNVFAHVPDINDFTLGLREVLKPGGTVTLEFPHLMRLLEHDQFDTVYHEHFSYLSLFTTCAIFEKAGLRVQDLEELPTHGGSLRVHGCHANDSRPTTTAVAAMLAEEERRGMRHLSTYAALQSRAEAIKDELLMFLVEQKRLGKSVAAYGAAAKGNTLLNFAGVKPDLLSFICDAAPAKQGKFTPGSHIPIVGPGTLARERPDVVLILPWNIADEVVSQLAEVRRWDGRFYVAVPRLREIR